MSANLTREISSHKMNARQCALDWLSRLNVFPTQLTALNGLCNHVFLVEQESEPKRSIVRLADHSVDGDLCPLAHQSRRVIGLHHDAAALGLSPPLLASDEGGGMMWMSHAGQERILRQADFAQVSALLERLHHSQLLWSFYPDSQKTDPLRMARLRELLCRDEKVDQPLQKVIERLLEQEARNSYSGLPLVPTHGDLNPGNVLHDGERWWIIDWDFAGLNCQYWDTASIVNSHQCTYDLAADFVGASQLHHLPWFCCHYELLSRDWHIRRGSSRSVIHKSTKLIEYWSHWLK